jgi:hypothetical protein
MGRPCAALVLVDRNLNTYADRNDIETFTVGFHAELSRLGA